MKTIVRLSDGRMVDWRDLGRMPDGTVIDRSPLSEGRLPRRFEEDGVWHEIRRIPAEAERDAEALEEAQIPELMESGIIREIRFDSFS